VIGGTTTGARNVISGNTSHGVLLDGNGTDGTLEGNYVGTDATGTTAVPNGTAVGDVAAIRTRFGFGTRIGGTINGARNVISGNTSDGISIESLLGEGATVQGNYVGTNAAGTAALANGRFGIRSTTANVIIGGTTDGARNLISGNASDGIFLTNDGALIQGNYVGTDATGTAAIGNGLAGINVRSISNATIGGTAAGAANRIAFNSGAGVSVGTAMVTTTGNVIRGNSIFSNGGLGIDLTPAGVTMNDAGDADGGANTLRNFPVLTSVSVATGVTRVSGMLHSAAMTSFTLVFYAGSSCDASQHGEGQTYLGSTGVFTDHAGLAGFTVLDLASSSVGNVVTATAIDPSGNTSEFSACRSLEAPAVIVSPLAVAVSEGGAGGVFTVALNGVPTDAVTIGPSFNTPPLGVSPGPLTFEPDSSALTPRLVTVTAVDNATADGTRTASITFATTSSDAGYHGLAVDAVTTTVVDDEGPAALTVASLSAPEPSSGTSTATLTVTLSPASSQTVAVQYATGNGTATGGAACTPGVDYLTTSGALTFTPGQTSKPIPVTICGDSVAEPSQTFTVALSTPTGPSALGSPSTVTVTITNTGGQLPPATADSYTVAAGTTLTVPAAGVLANDGNIGVAGPLTAQVATQPGHGSLTLNPNGGFSYTPHTSFGGTDTFSYRVSDGSFQSPPAMVTIVVTPTACVPRPRVQTKPAAGGGALQVRVEATPLNTQANNPLHGITFGEYLNAKVTLNGQSIASGQTYIMPAGVVFVDFTVTRDQPGLPTTVEFTVVDGCGSWDSLAGGGNNAGF